MIDRRTFLAGTGAVLLAAPLAAEAQQAKKPYKIGYLSANLSQPNPSTLQSFLQGLRDLGYGEGRDFIMEYRFAEGQTHRLPELAAGLVRTRVDVIVTGGTLATRAAKQATQTIPIVFAVIGGAVEKGMVTSLARPGGNVTGLQLQVRGDKPLQLLKEAVPTVTRVVFLHDVDSNSPGFAERIRSYARALNIEVQLVAMRDPNGVTRAFAEFGHGTNGLLIDGSSIFGLTADQICKLALQRMLPSTGAARAYADAGCLMSYAENHDDMYRRAALYVDKILKGAKPADLPVEQAAKFDLTINLKTAKALGLTIPPSLLGRADEVIQ